MLYVMMMIGFAQESMLNYFDELNNTSRRVEVRLIQSRKGDDAKLTSCLEERYNEIIYLIDVMKLAESRYQASPRSLRTTKVHQKMKDMILEQAFNIETSADLCGANYEEDKTEYKVKVALEAKDIPELGVETYQDLYPVLSQKGEKCVHRASHDVSPFEDSIPNEQGYDPCD